VFIVEDVYVYKGFPTKQLCFGDKIGFLKECFERYLVQQFDEPTTTNSPQHLVAFALPAMWMVDAHCLNHLGSLPEQVAKTIGYTTHHIQYRSLYKISPYLNVYLISILHSRALVHGNATIAINDILEYPLNTGMQETSNVPKPLPIATVAAAAPPAFRTIPEKPHYMDFGKPQYRYPAIFQVCADKQYDIYHLYAYGRNKEYVYYNVAYIPNYRTSVFMNSLFRKIRENTNLDYIEESDDEEDFEDVREDKYVDLQKVLYMECVFQPKFKKWIPTRVCDARDRVVHISKL
jgi:hypothetical protein